MSGNKLCMMMYIEIWEGNVIHKWDVTDATNII